MKIKITKDESKAIADENAKMNDAVLVHMRAWNHLELYMSTMLASILNLDSKIPFVIYYSPDGFDMRNKMVDSSFREFLKEKNITNTFLDDWNKINDELGMARKMRNKVAHGSTGTFFIRGKNYVRHCAPVLDFRRVGDLIPKGSIPGITADEILEANKNALNLADTIDLIGKAITAFHKNGLEAWQEKLAGLKACLRKFPDRRPPCQMPKEQQGQPQSLQE